jgi:uncharacterized protein YjiS (DUF1127 family)
MLLSIIASVQKSFKRYLKYRQTMYELGRLTNRDLADLGIARGDIEYIARKHSMSKI